MKPTEEEDARAREYILYGLSDSVINVVEACETAVAMVDALKKRYQSHSTMTMIGRLDQLMDTRYTPGMEMSDYLGAVAHHVQQIKNAGGLDLDKLHACVLLRNMPNTPEWTATIGALKVQNESDLDPEKVSSLFMEVSRSVD